MQADSRIQDLHQYIDRAFCKPPVMVLGYGAGQQAIQNDLEAHMDSLDQPSELIEPHMDILMQILAKVVPAMVDLTNALRKGLPVGPKDFDPTLEEHWTNPTWISPDNFPVVQNSQVLHDECFDTLNLNNPIIEELTGEKTEKLRLRNNLPEKIDHEASRSKMLKGISPNFVHTVDAAHIRMIARSCDKRGFVMMHTHDDLGCHANHYFTMNEVIRKTFAHIHKQDVLAKYTAHNPNFVAPAYGSLEVAECEQAVLMFS